jgi:hypothetical protein
MDAGPAPIVNARPTLPASFKAGLLELVETASGPVSG